MKTLLKTLLLDADSNTGFRELSLDAKCLGLGDDGPHVSIRSYTLHGGLREGVQVVEIDNGTLSVAVLPTRGMGVWKGRCGDTALGWESPVKDPVHPAFINPPERGGLGWLKGFNEWIVRCGLNSMGAPGTDTVLDYSGNPSEVQLSLHGNIANTPARRVELEVTEEAIILRGEVDETMMFGPALRLNTELRMGLGSKTLEIYDTVTNLGNVPVEHELLYHINYGPPLLEKGSRLVTPFKHVAPRDPRAAEGIKTFDRYSSPQTGFVEQAYFFEQLGKRGSRETLALLRNAAGNRASLLRYSLKDLPCFTLWKNTASTAEGYVTGLEPCTSYPNTRHAEREKGRVITLEGGASRDVRLSIEGLDTKTAVQAAEGEIRKLQKSAKPTVHPEPIPRYA